MSWSGVMVTVVTLQLTGLFLLFAYLIHQVLTKETHDAENPDP